MFVKKLLKKTQGFNAAPFYKAAGGGITPTTLNPSDISGGSLDASNLIFTFAGGGADGGVRSVAGKTTGKFYFEITATSGTFGSDSGVGISTGGASFASLGNDATSGLILYVSGNAWFNGSSLLGGATGAWTAGNTVGIAVDMGAELIWFEIANNTWSNSGNPAAGTGGLSFSALTGPYYATVTGSAGAAQVSTANFGASAFAFSVPSGFTAGLSV